MCASLLGEVTKNLDTHSVAEVGHGVQIFGQRVCVDLGQLRGVGWRALPRNLDTMTMRMSGATR